MSYAEAKARYAAIGVDTEAAIARLKAVPISLHCWQGDDVRGFDTDPTKPLTGGIQTTGGATTNASNLTVDTSGNSAAAIRSDRGGGTVLSK